MKNVTRLCQTKSIVTVNGQLPGPRIIAREGDRLLIKVVNHVKYNVTLHWYENLVFLLSLSLVIYGDPFQNSLIILSLYALTTKQAWSPAAEKRMGRWTCICHTVPNSNRAVLCIQLHCHWPKRDVVLARSHLMA